MKSLLLGLAFGAAAGVLLSELPAVKDVLHQGKKKVKSLTR